MANEWLFAGRSGAGPGGGRAADGAGSVGGRERSFSRSGRLPGRRDFLVSGNYLFAPVASFRQPVAAVRAFVAGGVHPCAVLLDRLPGGLPVFIFPPPPLGRRLPPLPPLLF